MKYILATCAATFVSLCAAQGLGLNDLPSCAKPCAASLPPQCGISVECICSDKDWITSISCCVKERCPEAEQKKTVDAAQQICDTVKVTLPSAAVCPGAGATGTSTGGSSSSTGTSMGSSTMTGSSMSGTSTRSAASGASSMASTATSSAGQQTTATPAATGAGNQHMAPAFGAGAAIVALALL